MLKEVMSLPGAHDKIEHSNTGTITSWWTDNNNRHQVLVRSTMNDKVVSNVKIKQERFADWDAVDVNTEPCNVNEYDGSINSDESHHKNTARKDNLVDSREKKQNETTSRDKIWRECGNTFLVCMIVYVVAGRMKYELMIKVFGNTNTYLWRVQKNAVSMIMTGVFDLGEHFSVTDGYKIGWEYIHRIMKLQKHAILEQGRVSKSNLNIA